ncbi:6-phosphogluconolactonase [Ruicaihuangia caeni]|uniref:6-phosphogluconolactonase n=1 Tax=Ruicaihuangia caeni TaxID=3042517 RepID=UPI00338FC88A
MNDRRVVVLDDADALVAAVAARFVELLSEVLAEQEIAHVVLEGGRVHLRTLSAIAESPELEGIDWSRVHIWWGDERFVPHDDAERNAGKAQQLLLNRIDIPQSNVHAMPASDEIQSLDEAAERYAQELARFSTGDDPFPHFDITFLGVGPDGHTASLFPGKDEVLDKESTVLPVRNSPKPPPERITLTRRVLNASRRVIASLSGDDKAAVLGLALAGASYAEVPIAGVKGRLSTTFYVDEAAAAQVPEELIAPGAYWTASDAGEEPGPEDSAD